MNAASESVIGICGFAIRLCRVAACGRTYVPPAMCPFTWTGARRAAGHDRLEEKSYSAASNGFFERVTSFAARAASRSATSFCSRWDTEIPGTSRSGRQSMSSRFSGVNSIAMLLADQLGLSALIITERPRIHQGLHLVEARFIAGISQDHVWRHIPALRPEKAVDGALGCVLPRQEHIVRPGACVARRSPRRRSAWRQRPAFPLELAA